MKRKTIPENPSRASTSSIASSDSSPRKISKPNQRNITASITSPVRKESILEVKQEPPRFSPAVKPKEAKVKHYNLSSSVRSETKQALVSLEGYYNDNKELKATDFCSAEYENLIVQLGQSMTSCSPKFIRDTYKVAGKFSPFKVYGEFSAYKRNCLVKAKRHSKIHCKFCLIAVVNIHGHIARCHKGERITRTYQAEEVEHLKLLAVGTATGDYLRRSLPMDEFNETMDTKFEDRHLEEETKVYPRQLTNARDNGYEIKTPNLKPFVKPKPSMEGTILSEKIFVAPEILRAMSSAQGASSSVLETLAEQHCVTVAVEGNTLIGVKGTSLHLRKFATAVAAIEKIFPHLQKWISGGFRASTIFELVLNLADGLQRGGKHHQVLEERPRALAGSHNAITFRVSVLQQLDHQRIRTRMSVPHR